jgi:serine/threonine protein kinase/Tfp pilus assembly protein PilF
MLNRTNSAGSPSASNSSVLAELVDRLTGQVQAGEAIDWEAVARQYPEHVEELRGLLPALGAIDELSRSRDEALSGVGRIRVPVELESGVLGDFRIIREVGRGGMGVVYEAEQVSLGRRVALKVLPLAATMDPRHLQRFHNEARAAASLHHEHIVPVYGVGQERGVHYYAMQFIDGPTLAQLMARGRGGAPADTVDRTHAPSEPAAAPPAPAAPTTVARAADTAIGPRPPADYRAVAGWVAQAAEALEHAHQRGVVHRDVKPSNLMLDGTGKLWVADFGLARVGADGGLTGTGDVIGTLRYMSPEQATAKHGLVDHRTDVYGLGATLYELLTRRPAFEGDNPADLLPRVVLDEPAPPRSSDRGIPADLETITLKALAKEPAERYATAQELADDLRRFLEDHPIRAKRPGPLERLRKWTQRHKGLVRAAGLGLVVAVAALTTSTAWAVYKERQAEDARRVADDQRQVAEGNAAEADRQRRRADENFRKAVFMVDRMLQRANQQDLPRTPEIVRVQQAQADEAIPFFQELLAENRTDPQGRLLTAVAYHGLAVAQLSRGEHEKAGEALAQALAIDDQLVTKFPAEVVYAQQLNQVRGSVSSLLGVVKNEGESAARAGQHRAAANAFRKVVTICARIDPRIEVPGLPMDQAAAQTKLADALWALGQSREAEQVYGQALAAWERLAKSPPEASWPMLALSWQARTQATRGLLRAQDGRLGDAEADFRQALLSVDRLEPQDQGLAIKLALTDRARVRSALGNVLWATGRRQAATEAFRQAAQEWRGRRDTEVRNNELAWFLGTCPDAQFRNAKEAVELAQRTVGAVPEGSPWLTLGVVQRRPGDFRRTLGLALYRAGDWRAAATALRKGADLRAGGDSSDWFFLAMAHWQLGEKDTSRSWYEKALSWMKANRPDDEELRRFQQEAAQVLKSETKPKQ